VKALPVATVVLCLLALPALLVYVSIGRGYLDTTADITALRIDVVELRPVDDPRRNNPGPDVVLRVFGVGQSDLRFAEVNFDLLWQGQRVVTVASFPNASIPRNSSLTVTVPSNLDPAHAADTRALIAAGERRFQVSGNARIGLPNSDASVWLTLSGQVRATAAADNELWKVVGAPGNLLVNRQHLSRRVPAFANREGS
jgi:hypothetical protein